MELAAALRNRGRRSRQVGALRGGRLGSGEEAPPFEVTIEHPELRATTAAGEGPATSASSPERRPGSRRGALPAVHGRRPRARVRRRGDPELAVAVADGRRGGGIGTLLMNELAEAARATGFARLSLSVDAGNPALRLYERLGYRELTRDEDGVRMLLEL